MQREGIADAKRQVLRRFRNPGWFFTKPARDSARAKEALANPGWFFTKPARDSARAKEALANPGAFGDGMTGWDSLEDLLLWGKGELAALGLRESQASSEWLLAEVLGMERAGLYFNAKQRVARADQIRYAAMIAERANRIPTAYITKKAFFRNEVLAVTPECLIPRPETEGLVDRFIEHSGWRREAPFSFLDLGTGSGAIAVALLKHYPAARATLSDVSPGALSAASENIAAYGLSERAETVLSDCFDALAGRKWHAIISNPPYLSETDWQSVEPEILKEPRHALDGGPDGLRFYRRIIHEAGAHLEPGGRLVLEIGSGQAEGIRPWMETAGFENIRYFQDDAGTQRVVMASLWIRS